MLEILPFLADPRLPLASLPGDLATRIPGSSSAGSRILPLARERSESKQTSRVLNPYGPLRPQASNEDYLLAVRYQGRC